MKKWIVIALIAAAGCTQEAGSAAPGKAATPKACVEGMIAAMEKNDMAAFGTYFAEPARSKVKAMAEGAAAMDAATERLAKALDAKFGAGTASELHVETQKRPAMGKVEIVEIEEEGATARVKTKEAQGDEQTFTLAKIDGAWYVSPAKDDKRFGEKELRMADGLHAAMVAAAEKVGSLERDVESGKVATKDAAGKAFDQIKMAMAMSIMQAAQQK